MFCQSIILFVWRACVCWLFEWGDLCVQTLLSVHLLICQACFVFLSSFQQVKVISLTFLLQSTNLSKYCRLTSCMSTTDQIVLYNLSQNKKSYYLLYKV